jgi:hypothetical protein
MQKPLADRGKSNPRSLATLEKDLQQFQGKGMGNITKAKQYNNVIRPAIFDIPLDMVSIILEL